MSQIASQSPTTSESRQQSTTSGRSVTKGSEYPSRGKKVVAWIVGNIPTAAVLLVLVALGYTGHRTDWKISKFSELSGNAEARPADWCTQHGVLEAKCIECNPGKFPPPTDYGWCDAHGVHQCVFDHPDVAQLQNPTALPPEDIEQFEAALALRSRPENNFACKSYQRRIQFASHETVLEAGVDVEPVMREKIVESVVATGTVRYDETRVASLSSKAKGTVWRVEKQIGDHVRRGDVLAIVDAQEVGRLKADLLSALAEENLQKGIVNRLRGLSQKGITSGREFDKASTELAQARTRVLSAQQALVNLGLSVDLSSLRGLSEAATAGRLRLAGLPETTVQQVEEETESSNLLPIRSPLEGIVVERKVVAGEVVDTSKPLFRIANTAEMWLMLSVPLEDAKFVSRGQPVQFLPDGEDHPVEGEIDWISTTADQHTRTIFARATLPNSDGRLRNETFGAGQIIIRETPHAMVIPSEALQWDGSCHVVFVRDKDYFEDDAPKVFHPRSVRPGVKGNDRTELIAGVLPGEIVATLGSDVLKSELLKNNLGAG